MATVHLLLGGNTGDRSRFLHLATDSIGKNVGKILERSSIYETEPWGFEASTPFLNQVLRVDTGLAPMEVMHQVKNIERQLGRRAKRDKGSGYESRVIDIDILVYDNLVVSEGDLQIPHPRMHLRKFTLVPMAEISGQLKHPLLQVDIDTLNRECSDGLEVKLFDAG